MYYVTGIGKRLLALSVLPAHTHNMFGYSAAQPSVLFTHGLQSMHVGWAMRIRISNGSVHTYSIWIEGGF
jgi:hypothetical protein